MIENPTNTERSTCRQWTSDEIALMRQLAPGRPLKPELIAAFPGRTYAAIRLQLFQCRRALGVPLRSTAPDYNARQPEALTTILDRDDPGLSDNWPTRWGRKAERSNEQFLAAIRMVA